MSGYTQQEMYWTELVQLKSQSYYLDAYQIECERYDNLLKMFLAVVSSSSIATWAIWQRFGMLWGGIIAVSQVLNAIKSFLPWERRTREIASLGKNLADVLLCAEQNWYAVAAGELTERQIHNLVIDLRRRRNDAENTHLQGHSLPVKDKHRTTAAKRTKEYFRVNYGIGGGHA